MLAELTAIGCRSVFQVGDVVVDVGRCLVVRDGQEIPIALMLMRVMVALLECPGQVVSIATLGQLVWGNDRPDDLAGVVRAYVVRARRALGDSERIETIRGVGYRYVRPT